MFKFSRFISPVFKRNLTTNFGKTSTNFGRTPWYNLPSMKREMLPERQVHSEKHNVSPQKYSLVGVAERDLRRLVIVNELNVKPNEKQDIWFAMSVETPRLEYYNKQLFNIMMDMAEHPYDVVRVDNDFFARHDSSKSFLIPTILNRLTMKDLFSS